MKNLLFGITTLAVLLHFNPAFAKASEVVVAPDAHPISDLIDDWGQFRAGILAKTKQYDKYNDIKDSQAAMLPRTLIGTWSTENHDDKSGNQLHTELNLKGNHTFTYKYHITAGTQQQKWAFSGRWEEKNNILMLLIDKTSYPGEAQNAVLFWRLLHIGKSKLVYVKTESDRMMAMTRAARKFHS